MTSERFDDLTRTLASTASRRRVLKGLVASMAAALLPARALAGGGNSACAHFCNQMFPPGAARNKCVSDAAHGTGPCYVCGPGAPAPTAQCGQVCCADDEVCVDGACQPACNATGGICDANGDGTECCSGVCTCGGNQDAGHCQGPYFQGFETGANDWSAPITRVASGTHGITSKSGNFHAEVGEGAFSHLGGYSSVFPDGGYSTRISIYLDMTLNATLGTDTRFDYSVASSTADCEFLRDFMFNVGTDPTTVGSFAMSASNNSPGWPSNPGRAPIFVSQSGWYTFEHVFGDVAGALSVDLNVYGPSNVLLSTWTLSDPSDVIATVGGNRYGWFVTNEFSFLAIDDVQRD